MINASLIVILERQLYMSLSLYIFFNWASFHVVVFFFIFLSLTNIIFSLSLFLSGGETKKDLKSYTRRVSSGWKVSLTARKREGLPRTESFKLRFIEKVTTRVFLGTRINVSYSDFYFIFKYTQHRAKKKKKLKRLPLIFNECIIKKKKQLFRHKDFFSFFFSLLFLGRHFSLNFRCVLYIIRETFHALGESWMLTSFGTDEKMAQVHYTYIPYSHSV